MFRVCRVFCAVLLALVPGCASVNEPLTEDSIARRYDFDARIDRQAALPDTFVAASFSGGGVRASALAYSVLDDLQNYTLGADGRRLSDTVGFISAVSGGSVPAADFALRGEAFLRDFPKDFLYAHNTRDIALRTHSTFGPLEWLNPLHSRTRALEDYLDGVLYGEETFRTLVARDRGPYVVLNATDMSSGEVFRFTQRFMGNLCSDLADFKISRAVAASAAFPFLLQPVTLQNHSWDPACRTLRRRYPTTADPDIVPGLVAGGAAPINRFNDLDGYKKYRYTNSLRRDSVDLAPGGVETRQPFRQIEYVHLLDGGLVDNLGVKAVIEEFDGPTLRKLHEKGVRNFVYIVVNARSDQERSIDRSGEVPDWIDVFTSVTSNPIDTATASAASLVRAHWQRVYTDGQFTGKLPALYEVVIDFDLIEDPEVERAIKEVRTWWSLPAETIDMVMIEGKKLLRRNPCFMRFIQENAVNTYLPANHVAEKARECEAGVFTPPAEMRPLSAVR